MEPIMKFPNLQSPWRWDDLNNELVRDNDQRAEKADMNADTVSERIDLWNLPAGKRPPAYKKRPLEASKDKKVVAVGDIVHVALNMVSDTYYVPERFAELVRRPELEDFFLHLINYFYWFFEYLDSQVVTNPICVELNQEERARISNAKAHLDTALLLVAQKYSNIVLGTGLKQYHHFYWIEEHDEFDPLGTKREFIPYTGRVSRTLIDRGYAELLMIFATFVVWIAYERKDFEPIQTEIGRIIRTNSFPNPEYSTTHVRTRSTRKTASDAASESSSSNKTVRLQKTIAVADVNAYASANAAGVKKESFRRLLNQRSPILVTLLPTARDQSSDLFSRRKGKNDKPSQNVQAVPEDEFQIQHKVGVLGQPIDTLTLIGREEKPETGASSAQPALQTDDNRTEAESAVSA